MSPDNFLMKLVKKSVGLPTGDSDCCGSHTAPQDAGLSTAARPELPGHQRDSHSGETDEEKPAAQAVSVSPDSH